MWQGEPIWLNFVKNIIAADIRSAVFLAAFIKNGNTNHSVANAHELVDLNRYKVIKNKRKVQAALINREQKPFVFFVCKN